MALVFPSGHIARWVSVTYSAPYVCSRHQPQVLPSFCTLSQSINGAK